MSGLSDVKDICGIICAILTWLLILYAEFVVMGVMLFPSLYTVYSLVNSVVFQIFAFLACASHLRTMFTDPGAVPKGNATKEMIQQMGLREGQVIFKCPKCCSIKPERAHHCSMCQENGSPLPLVEWKQCSSFSPPATVVLILFLVFEALLFAIFTAIMLGTQLQAIWNDETGIEQLKKEEARWVKKSRWKSIQAVFGRFSLAWFSPFTRPPLKSKIESYLYSV
ncbi:hypothetical protein RUM44_009598 [Polyplax serrata]|uniref:Protein S-acyltransferase n=1 Tax=Polyplax serrata TaxID=468196 RepID=A0ABR1AT48_POLSC